MNTLNTLNKLTSLALFSAALAYGQGIQQGANLKQLINAQSGTSYTYVTADFGKLVTHANAGAIAGTLPQCGAAGFATGFNFDVMNTGAGTLTITPTTSTIDGVATLALSTGTGAHIVCDGTNYKTWHGGGGGCVDIVPWTAVPALLNGWINQGGSQAAQYHLTCFGRIETRGRITSGTTTNGTPIFTLPGGSRPAFATASLTYADNTAGVEQLNFATNGSVTISGASAPATFIDLNGGAAPQGTPPAGFTFCRSITPNAGQITGTITNFAVPIIGTFNAGGGTLDLRTVANGGPIQNASGFDIVLFSDSGCTTLVPFERVTWDAATGVSEFWVLDTSINSSSNTPLYIGGGSASVTTDQSNPAGVWTPGGHVLVSHLPNGASLTVADSTGLKTGTNHSATAGAGQLDGAAAFDGTNSWIDYGTTTAIPHTGNTVMAWVNPSVGTGQLYVIDDYTGTGGVSFRLQQFGTLNIEYDYLQDNSNFSLVDTSLITIPTGSWSHIAATYDGTTIKIYVNGAAVALGSQTNTGTVTADYTPGVFGVGGRNGSTSNRMNGLIDEARVVTSAYVAGTIATVYNAQNSPSAFITIGP